MTTFYEIERKTCVKSSSAQRIWQSAHERAGSDDLHDILTCKEPIQVPGRPELVADGIVELAAILTLLYELKVRYLSRYKNYILGVELKLT